MDKIFLIDSGHGGMIDGQYQTAPSKMYHHPNGEIAYEGVINRLIKDMTMELFRKNNIRFIDVCPSEMDLDLDVRCNVINAYCDEFGKNNCLLISLHMNAGKGTGFEIWTSPGATKSDMYATMFMNEFESHFPGIRPRKDTTDGDVDKESAFYILVNSKCPAILPEWLFYDNYNDWVIQRETIKQLDYAKMILNFTKRVLIKNL